MKNQRLSSPVFDGEFVFTAADAEHDGYGSVDVYLATISTPYPLPSIETKSDVTRVVNGLRKVADWLESHKDEVGKKPSKEAIAKAKAEAKEYNDKEEAA